MTELTHLRKLLADRHLLNEETGCWEWQMSKTPGAYGQVWHEGRMQVAHRVYYKVCVGPIPEGLVLDHLCRNPGCVNPDHLEPVTQRVNVMRGDAVTRINATKTHCVHGHELSGDNLYPTTRYRR